MKYSFFAVLAFLTLPVVALAGGSEGFVPLVGIPGLEGQPTFDNYVDALYALAISVAALIAVIQIVIGGAQYMMSDLITSKSAAKERIKNALIGLLIIIAAALILTTINSNLTNLEINAPEIEIDNSTPDPVDTFAGLCAGAIERGSACSSFSCVISDTYNETSCAQDCAAIGGTYDAGWTYDECMYAVDLADSCDPQSSFACCERIRGGDWNETNNSCSGMTSQETRIAQCYSGGNGTWDQTNNTCRTTDCNPNTDSQCCSLGFGGTLEGGRCITGTSELDCQALGRVWDATTNTCAPGTVTNDAASCRARGAGYVWRTGSCIQFTNTFPAQTDNCAEGDISCLNSLCQSGGLGIVYIPELEMCGTDPSQL